MPTLFRQRPRSAAISTRPRLPTAAALASAIIAVLVLATGCTSELVPEPAPETESRQRPRIVASDALLADAIAAMTGRAIQVDALVPADVDPATAEPTGADLARLQAADLVVVFELDYAPHFRPLLEEVAATEVEVLQISPLMDPFEAGSDGGEPSRYIWHDPERMAEGLDAAFERMGQLRVELATDEIEAAFADYQDELVRIDREMAEALAPIPLEETVLLTAGAELDYLAERYGFEIRDISTEGALDELAAADRGVVFGDVIGVRPRTLPQSTTFVTLHTRALARLGNPADTYRGLLLDNVQAIVAASEAGPR